MVTLFRRNCIQAGVLGRSIIIMYARGQKSYLAYSVQDAAGCLYMDCHMDMVTMMFIGCRSCERCEVHVVDPCVQINNMHMLFLRT